MSYQKVGQISFISYFLTLTDIWHCNFQIERLGRNCSSFFEQLVEEHLVKNLNNCHDLTKLWLMKGSKTAAKVYLPFIVTSGHFKPRDCLGGL